MIYDEKRRRTREGPRREGERKLPFELPSWESLLLLWCAPEDDGEQEKGEGQVHLQSHHQWSLRVKAIKDWKTKTEMSIYRQEKSTWEISKSAHHIIYVEMSNPEEFWNSSVSRALCTCAVRDALDNVRKPSRCWRSNANVIKTHQATTIIGSRLPCYVFYTCPLT